MTVAPVSTPRIPNSDHHPADQWTRQRGRQQLRHSRSRQLGATPTKLRQNVGRQWAEHVPKTEADLADQTAQNDPSRATANVAQELPFRVGSSVHRSIRIVVATHPWQAGPRNSGRSRCAGLED